jgi:hypothetical protein
MLLKARVNTFAKAQQNDFYTVLIGSASKPSTSGAYWPSPCSSATKSAHSPRKLIIGLLVTLLISIISLYPAHRLVEQLYVHAGFWISLAWGFGSIIAVAVCFRLAKDQPMIAARAAAAILVVDAVVLFFVPSLAGVSGGQTHAAGVDYLRQHIGINRFYTLGPIQPNYSAFYGISSINHNALPIAANWAKYVTDRLDPYAHPVFFTGNYTRDPKAPSAAEVLQRNFQQFEEIGVRYVVSPHSLNLFESANGCFRGQAAEGAGGGEREAEEASGRADAQCGRPSPASFKKMVGPPPSALRSRICRPS